MTALLDAQHESRQLQLRIASTDEGAGERAPTRLLITVQDTSEAHAAEQALTSLRERLNESQRLESIGRLATGVAHDFNNLLTVVMVCGEQLMRGFDADTRERREAKAIVDSCERARTLTTQMLTLARAPELGTGTTDINAALREVSTLLTRAVGERVELQLLLDPEAGVVESARGDLDHIVMNLVLNARDAMPTGGTIIVRTRVLPAGPRAVGGDMREWVELTVRDEGHGMNEDTLERIFQPFFSTKVEGSGTGVGLANVKELVERAGGSIRVRSEEGLGTTFFIRLPRAAQRRTMHSQVVRAPAPVSGQRVLLVEDEATLNLLLTRTLESNGFEVISVSSAEEAETWLNDTAAQEQPIDLLITDLVLPRRSGKQLATVVRETFPSVRVLFMSGYAQDALGEPTGPESHTAFLSKPFTPSDLHARLCALLDGRDMDPVQTSTIG